ncbi:SDR family oxidoreductase [Limibacter armeniacum]|uniref:SDR family oxidoreductase n=1 Tax=Limibacter armeniacum TaxID=466084 RepID=UPI002FE5BB2D
MSNSKVILITGTSSGFGNLMAKTLAAKGHHVYATMRNTEGKNFDAANQMRDLQNIEVIDLDVSKDKSVKKAVKAIIKEKGRIDVLVNNAGGGGIGLTESYSIEDVKHQFEVNVFGVFRVTKAVLPQMREQKEGLIVNISSLLGRFTAPYFSIYASSKFALEGMAETWRYEFANIGVDSVIVEPGAFPTTSFSENMDNFSPQTQEAAKAYGNTLEVPKKFESMLEESVKSGDYLKPQAVADAVAKLIETPHGKRPLRTVVDKHLTETFDKLNEHSEAVQQELMKAMFQMEI